MGTRQSKSKRKGKKLLLLVMLIGIIILAGYFLITAANENKSDEFLSMNSNAERVEFLNKQGYIVVPEAVHKEEILIPSEFNEVYMEYSDFQKEQGFDLEKHKGKEATLFSYTILNYPEKSENVVANMLIIDGILIAGEVNLNEEGGFTEPLLSKSTQTFLEPLPEAVNLL